MEKKFINIDDRNIAYIDTGSGDPIVFLHGNPTSSWLWRNILPPLKEYGDCVAPDLLGMGDSEPFNNTNHGFFSTHAEFFSKFMHELQLNKKVTLVLHDWGSALGFDWAKSNPESVKGIAYMEAIVKPLSWEEWPDESRDLFKALRSSSGERLILDKNIFVERVLPGSIKRSLTEDEMNEYRRPFINPANRLTTLFWPRELPIDNNPADVCRRVQSYAEWMNTNNIPKLFINAEPGAILVGNQREFCRKWLNQKEVTVPGIHFIQEDSAVEIVNALSKWLQII
ncbi:MAG: haloalkane dehalogenase [Pseudomonadota bacterium]|nr:haloalkane dehalogenase [Pseudomonadota bacterium]